MVKYYSVTIHIQKGDILISKKGILQHSTITEKDYIVKKIKFIGKECFECLGEKVEMNIKEINS